MSVGPSTFSAVTSNEAREIKVSTPVGDPFVPRFKQSPIKNKSRAPLNSQQRSQNVVLNASFSSTSTLTGSRMHSSLLEIRNVCHCGFVDVGLSQPRNVPVMLRNNYNAEIQIDAQIDSLEAGAFTLSAENKFTFVPPSQTMALQVGFLPREECMYNGALLITATPQIRGYPPRKYRVHLIGFGGTTSVRIEREQFSAVNNAYSSSTAPLSARSAGQYDVRLSERRSTTLVLKNSGSRSAFVYIKAMSVPLRLDHSACRDEEVPTIALSIQPRALKLEKRVRNTQKVALTVVCDALWSKIVAGDCDLRLAVYYGPERQRLRQAKYVEMKHMNVEPIDDIDFTRLPLDANLADVSRQQHAPELPTLTADDIRVFNQELQVSYVCLLPPINSMAYGAFVDENTPLGGYDYDQLVFNYDNDEFTTKLPVQNAPYQR